jgi:hypothetical protein
LIHSTLSNKLKQQAPTYIFAFVYPSPIYSLWLHIK